MSEECKKCRYNKATFSEPECRLKIPSRDCFWGEPEGIWHMFFTERVRNAKPILEKHKLYVSPNGFIEIH